MPFKLVYYSQQDPQWKKDSLGFGDPGDTIGYVDCALTNVAMLLSGHGYAETPKTLNQKLKNVDGFVSAGIRWGAVSQVYPQVDRSPSEGIQTHWVVLYGKKGDDYLMLDPWPYQPDVTKEDLLMKCYTQGKTLKRAISHVILFEAYGSGPSGPIATPGTQPTTAPVSTNEPWARVKDSVTWGLNIRSSIDVSSMANVVATVPAGTQLALLEPDGVSKIGAINQWVRVRTPLGREGFAAAWYLETIPGAIPAPVTPAESSKEKEDKLIVAVSGAVGTSGLRLRKTASKGGALIAVLKAGTRLTVLEPTKKAKAKIGKANQWLYVRGPKNQKGYVGAEYVKLA